MSETSNADNVTLAYQAGWQRFCGINLLAAPGALVPRAETELLARTTARLFEPGAGWAVRLIDMCCGSGNLACYLGVTLPNAQIWAADLTEPCVDLTRRNVAQLDLGERVHVLQGDLFAALHDLELEGTVDAVVCNPPYISSGKLASDRAPLLEQEPREAFDGGPYGISIHQRVMQQALAFLKPGGWLLFEFGLGQERQIEKLFARTAGYTDFALRFDEHGQPRVALARKG